jgi:hypothetical protein
MGWSSTRWSGNVYWRLIISHNKNTIQLAFGLHRVNAEINENRAPLLVFIRIVIPKDKVKYLSSWTLLVADQTSICKQALRTPRNVIELRSAGNTSPIIKSLCGAVRLGKFVWFDEHLGGEGAIPI